MKKGEATKGRGKIVEGPWNSAEKSDVRKHCGGMMMRREESGLRARADGEVKGVKEKGKDLMCVAMKSNDKKDRLHEVWD